MIKEGKRKQKFCEQIRRHWFLVLLFFATVAVAFGTSTTFAKYVWKEEITFTLKINPSGSGGTMDYSADSASAVSNADTATPASDVNRVDTAESVEPTASVPNAEPVQVTTQEPEIETEEDNTVALEEKSEKTTEESTVTEEKMDSATVVESENPEEVDSLPE